MDMQNSNSDVVVLQNNVAAAVDGATLTVLPFSTVVVELTITNTATVTFEGSTHTIFSALNATNMSTGVTASTATASGLYQINVAGLATFRARVSAFTSGNITAVARATSANKGYQ
jgi:hypothetical protein